MIPGGLCSPSEGPGQLEEMGREEPLEIPQRQMQILHQQRLGQPVRISAVEKGWGRSVYEYMGWNFRNQVS